MSSSSKHAGNRLRSYFQIHLTVMAQFEDTGLVEDHTEWVPEAGSFHLRGEICIRGGYRIDVFKRLAVYEQGGERWVRTTDYAYNVVKTGTGNVWRWDNAHAWPGHPTNHHRHVYDSVTGAQLPGSPEHVGEEWPTLGEVVQLTLDLIAERADREELTDPGRMPPPSGRYITKGGRLSDETD